MRLNERLSNQPIETGHRSGINLHSLVVAGARYWRRYPVRTAGLMVVALSLSLSACTTMVTDMEVGEAAIRERDTGTPTPSPEWIYATDQLRQSGFQLILNGEAYFGPSGGKISTANPNGGILLTAKHALFSGGQSVSHISLRHLHSGWANRYPLQKFAIIAHPRDDWALMPFCYPEGFPQDLRRAGHTQINDHYAEVNGNVMMYGNSEAYQSQNPAAGGQHALIKGVGWYIEDANEYEFTGTPVSNYYSGSLGVTQNGEVIGVSVRSAPGRVIAPNKVVLTLLRDFSLTYDLAVARLNEMCSQP